MAALVQTPRKSSLLNTLFSLLLLALCLISYALFLILFLKPEAYRLDSLIYVDRPSAITPAVAVGLIAALLAGATSAFITRCVEQSLWLKLVPREVKQPLTVGETTRLAQWSVSPLERVKYIFTGKFWLLKLSGPLLLATTIVAPVLLAGISQTVQLDVSSTRRAPSIGVWNTYVNLANSRSRGGSARDLVFGIALEASFNNFSAPVAAVCEDEACRVTSQSAALFATCTPGTIDNTQGMGLTVCRDRSALDADFCSDVVPSLCANLTCGAPSVFANFVVSREASCYSEGGSASTSCGQVPGAWGAVFGVWVGGADMGSGNTAIINTVDCEIEYGNLTVTQVGTRSPEVDRSRFKKSEYLLSDYPEDAISNVRAYTWGEGGSKSNTLSFTLRVVGTGWNDLYQNSAAYGLLGFDAIRDAETVARRIEKAFDFATLSAFARDPNASNIVIRNQEETRLYVYNRLMLLILLVPFIATLAGSWGRWAVGSDEDVLGYNPLAIACRGPVYGLFPTAFTVDSQYRKQCEEMKVKGYPDATGSGQDGVTRAGLLVEQ